MQTAQILVQNSVITSFLVTDFIQDESTIQVIMFFPVLLVVIRKETYTLMRKESDNFAFQKIQTFKGNAGLHNLIKDVTKTRNGEWGIVVSGNNQKISWSLGSTAKRRGLHVVSERRKVRIFICQFFPEFLELMSSCLVK